MAYCLSMLSSPVQTPMERWSERPKASKWLGPLPGSSNETGIELVGRQPIPACSHEWLPQKKSIAEDRPWK